MILQTLERRMPHTIIAAAALLAGGTAVAQTGQKIPLQLKFVTGAVSHYTMTMQMTMTMAGAPTGKGGPAGPMVTSTSVDFHNTVQQVLPNGNAVVVTEMDKMDVVVNGKHQDAPPVKPITMTIDPHGRIVSSDMADDPSNPLHGMMGGQMGFGSMLPLNPVAPGDSWDPNITIPGNKGQAAVRSKFVALEQVGTVQTARVETAGFVPLKLDFGSMFGGQSKGGGGQALMQAWIKISGVTNVRVDTGEVARGGADVHMAISMPGGSPAASKGAKTGSGRRKTAKAAPAKPVSMHMDMHMAINQVL